MAFLPYGLASTSFVIGGNGSDGSLSTSGNVSLTSTLDGDAVVKQYTSLTVNTGHTLTVSNRCKGLHIYVRGDLVLNGTISMTARGANILNTNQSILYKKHYSGIFGLQEFQNLAYILPNSFPSSTSSVRGGDSVFGIDSSSNGNAGSNGTLLFQCGGGGSGSVYSASTIYTATSGVGGYGTSFSGGSGSGGSAVLYSSQTSQSGSNTGGAGSSGKCSHSSFGACGGAGNPGGAGEGTGSLSGNAGTGGQLIVIVGGTLSGSGVFESKGSAGGGQSGTCGGGGSGGGCLLILYQNSSFSGTKLATGGAGGAGSVIGGAGGNGYIHYGTINDFWNTYG